MRNKKYYPAVSRDEMNKILDFEGLSIDLYKKFIDRNYQENKLLSLKALLPLTNLDQEFQGRINEYPAVSHHVWLTNMDKPRDILTYVSDEFKHNKYNPNKVTGGIDDIDNTFIGSIKNLDKGAQESKLPISDDHFHHILWTNYSREDLIQHPELTNLRKICNIDEGQIELPEFIVININDVMNNEISEIRNQAKLDIPLPNIVISGLSQMKYDLLSVDTALEKMFNEKKFASMSDVVRLAAVKNLGGIYFDVDYNFFDQLKLHDNKQYHMFDLMKHYNSIIGKESNTLQSTRLCNSIISAGQPNSKVITSMWDIVERNIISQDPLYYIKYPKNDFHKVICETGPIATTVGFLRAEEEYDIALDFGALYYNNFKRPSHELKLKGDVGPIGYDTWGGSWLECKYKQYKSYLYYDEDGRGITEAEWEAMF